MKKTNKILTPRRAQSETEHSKETEVQKMKRVSFKEYQILKMIYKNVVVISASDNEALIFIRK